MPVDQEGNGLASNGRRQDVFWAVDGERQYQNDRWGEADERNTLGDFILYMARELEKARDDYTSPAHPLEKSLDGVRKVVALGCAAMEKFGIGNPREGYHKR